MRPERARPSNHPLAHSCAVACAQKKHPGGNPFTGRRHQCDITFVDDFLDRHPEVRLLKSSAIAPERVAAACSEVRDAWFETYRGAIKQLYDAVRGPTACVQRSARL